MAGVRTLEENIEKLEQATQRAREATREANSAAKEANNAKKELELKMRDVLDMARKMVDDAIDDAVKQGLVRYTESIKIETAKAHKHVIKEFDKLSNIMLYGNPQGKGKSLVEDWVSKAIREEMNR